jgi:hypothetical protein
MGALLACRKDKLLHTMVLLKLGLARKKVLLFVNSIDAGFRLRLFLEAFGIRSAVLNAELPLNSRHHILQVCTPFSSAIKATLYSQFCLESPAACAKHSNVAHVDIYVASAIFKLLLPRMSLLQSKLSWSKGRHACLPMMVAIALY